MATRLTRRQLFALTGGATAAVILAACNSQEVPVPTTAPPQAPTSAPATAPTATAQPAGGAQPTTAAQPTPAAQPTAAPQPTAAAAPAGPPVSQVPREQTLIMSVSDTVGQMPDATIANPHLNSQLRTGWHFAFEPLFFYNPYWTTSVNGPKWAPPGKEGEIPYLATSYTYSDDFTQIIVKLRPNVTWSDGQPFNAKDVVFTIQMLLNNAPKLNWSSDMKLWVKDVSAPDDLTVKFVLNTPNPRFFFTYFCWRGDYGFPIVPEHIFKGQDPLTFTNLDLNKGWPITTGPWKLVLSTPQQKFYDRRDDWWGAKTGFAALPRMKRVIVLPRYEDAKLSQLLIANQVDATHNLNPADTELVLAKNPKLQVRAPDRSKPWGWMDFWTNGLQFNCAKPPFNDPDIRWALNYALSRQQIVDVGFKGNTTSTVLPFAAFPAMQPYYDEAKNLLVENPVDTYDVDKAAQIMQKKGYAKDAGGFWAKDGKRFSFIILTSPGFFENFATVEVAAFRKAGFDASYKAPTNGGDLEASGDADIWIDGYQGSYKDPYYGMEEFHSRHSAPIGTPADFGHRWKNEQFDKIVDDMAKLPSSDPKFHDLYRQGMGIWIKELPSLPTVQWNLIVPVNTSYWKSWPDANSPYGGPHLWHRGDAALTINTLDPA